MNIEDLTIAQVADEPARVHPAVGKYVVVRCHDAGVHAGLLTATQGRECSLSESRRLWYWKPANGAKYLSGVATEGLDPASRIGAPVTIHLTEICEIIECTPAAAGSIREALTDAK